MEPCGPLSVGPADASEDARNTRPAYFQGLHWHNLLKTQTTLCNALEKVDPQIAESGTRVCTSGPRRMKGERMETTISEIRSIVQRRRELEIEDQRLYQRFLELLELNQGTRKSSRDRLSPESGKALFAGLKRGSHERSKAR